MHMWGDEWFLEWGDELNDAIRELNIRLNKCHIAVAGKEKYGCYRTDFFSLWDGSWLCWFDNYRKYINPSKPKLTQLLLRLWYKLDDLGMFINNHIGITRAVCSWQKKQVNMIFQDVCKKHPTMIEELVSETDCYMYIKPGKYGNVDGITIFKKHWNVQNNV